MVAVAVGILAIPDKNALASGPKMLWLGFAGIGQMQSKVDEDVLAGFDFGGFGRDGGLQAVHDVAAVLAAHKGRKLGNDAEAVYMGGLGREGNVDRGRGGNYGINKFEGMIFLTRFFAVVPF